MSEWSKEKLEKTYAEVQKKAALDAEFRKELLKDANAAIEKATGEKIPEGFTLKAVEQDPNYSATFVIPDLVSEELTEGEMKEMAGGVSFILGISACAAAVAVAGCPADACAAAGCAFDACAAQACGAKGHTGC